MSLSEFSNRKIGKFSKGMKRLVGFAAAMVGSPDLYILDEPTDGIDPLKRKEIRSILLEEKNRGATILLNSHLLTETEKISDRVGIISKGELVREGALEEISESSGGWHVEFLNASKEDIVLAGFKHLEHSRVYSFENSDSNLLNKALMKVCHNGAVLTHLSKAKTALEEILQKVEDGE